MILTCSTKSTGKDTRSTFKRSQGLIKSNKGFHLKKIETPLELAHDSLST